MRISLRQIVEKSHEVARVDDWLHTNLNKMTKWDDAFTRLVFRGKQKFWSKTVAREYERARITIRSSIRLVREAIKALVPEASHDKANDLAEQIITEANILLKFEQIVIEFRQSQN